MRRLEGGDHRFLLAGVEGDWFSLQEAMSTWVVWKSFPLPVLFTTCTERRGCEAQRAVTGCKVNYTLTSV